MKMTDKDAMSPSTENAIKYLEGMIFPQDFSPSTLRAVAVNKMAIAALLAQQEREKGCEYCNDPDTEYGAISFPRTETGEVDINKVEAVEACFCPMCGRELKEAPNEHDQ